MTQVIVFADTCPHCQREQPQVAHSLAGLMVLLYGGYPIEAYCVFCDQFWIVNLQKRVELGEAAAATWGGMASEK